MEIYKKDNGKIYLIELNEELSYFCFHVDHDREKYKTN